jgi:beta-N-acetylhexosaminidase
MDDMIGIADALPTISPSAAGRLDRALAGPGDAAPNMGAQTALLAKRDALLALVDKSRARA